MSKVIFISNTFFIRSSFRLMITMILLHPFLGGCCTAKAEEEYYSMTNWTGAVYHTATGLPPCLPGMNFGRVLMTRTASRSQ